MRRYVGLMALIGLAGCTDPSASIKATTTQKPRATKTTQVQPKSKSTLNYEAMLRNATTITVEERVASVGKDYNILVDGRKVATVSGKDTHGLTSSIMGDVFTLKTVDGKVLASEKESKRFVVYDRAATFFDGQGNVTGYVAEDMIKNMFSLSYIFHFYNAHEREVGKSSKFTNSSLGNHPIYDNRGNVDYDIDKKFTAIADKYVVTVKDKDSEIPLEHALLLVCIEDAIGDAHK